MTHYRAIFISDVHLGTHDCKAEALVSFLKSNTCDKLFLVGDIIDGWHMKKKGLFWPDSHNEVVKTVMDISETETEVTYVTGNHDDFLRSYASAHNMSVGQIKIVNEDKYITKDGDVLWVVHGDEYDIAMTFYKTLEVVIGVIWTLLFWADFIYTKFCKLLGKPKFSLINFLKQKVRMVSEFTSMYEKEIVREAKFKEYHGVICGHIHEPKKQKTNDILYLNCGDWVDRCTAIAETEDGKFVILEGNKKNIGLPKRV